MGLLEFHCKTDRVCLRVTDCLNLRIVNTMPEVREENKLELVPIPLKNVTPAIPKKESEMKELVEDLTRMGC